MPELPEIETIKRGIEPLILNRVICKINIYNNKLRWNVPKDISQALQNQVVYSVQRRGKYLLLVTANNALIIHLGMSGSLRLLNYPHELTKHDHADIVFDNAMCLCFNDPRKFGSLLLLNTPLAQKLLRNLGLEPLSSEFIGKYLYEKSRTKKSAIKLLIMDNHVVTGVGNIYANEALFLTEIDPRKPANKVSLPHYELLVKNIKKILMAAIKAKGTTFKNFINYNGEVGSFKKFLKVYGREGLQCVKCRSKLQSIRIGQRNTVYCPKCQK